MKLQAPCSMQTYSVSLLNVAGGYCETAEYDSIPINWIVKPAQEIVIMRRVDFEISDTSESNS